MAKTDFLTLNSLSQSALFKVLERAHDLKKSYQAKKFSQTLAQHVLAMIFEKSSTRTRVSFEAGMTQLGGSAIFLSPTDTQLGRGEPLEDTARVLSEMVSAVMIRTDDHNKLVRFAESRHHSCHQWTVRQLPPLPIIGGCANDARNLW